MKGYLFSLTAAALLSALVLALVPEGSVRRTVQLGCGLLLALTALSPLLKLDYDAIAKQIAEIRLDTETARTGVEVQNRELQARIISEQAAAYIWDKADSLAVGDLGLLLVEILRGQAEEVARGREGEAGTGGVVTEDGDAEAGVEDLGGLVALAQIAQGVGHGEDRVDLVVGFVPGPIEVGLVHIVDAERLKMSRKFYSFAHNILSLLRCIL